MTGPVLIAAVSLPIVAILAALGFRSKDMRYRRSPGSTKFGMDDRVAQWDLIAGRWRHGSVREISTNDPQLYRVTWDDSGRDVDVAWHSPLTLYSEATYNPDFD